MEKEMLIVPDRETVEQSQEIQEWIQDRHPKSKHIADGFGGVKGDGDVERYLCQIVKELAAGNAIMIQSIPPVVSTQEAREILSLAHGSIEGLIGAGILERVYNGSVPVGVTRESVFHYYDSRADSNGTEKLPVFE